jgi:4'-phosphopantetheinyl transferase
MPIPNCPWPAAPTHPVLTANDVHVWCVSLEQSRSDYAPLLSTDELTRAERFHFESDRCKFTVGRGLLRVILDRYLGIESKNLEFAYSDLGKPTLKDFPNLKFNVTHSGELALMAFTLDREIGVDLEQIHPIDNVQQLAEQFFSVLERDQLRASSSDRLETFFSGWTRKEAWLKARGDGLTYPLDQFSVSLGPDLPARLLKVDKEPDKVAHWSLQSLSPAPGYIGALAVEGHGWRLLQWQMGFG